MRLSSPPLTRALVLLLPRLLLALAPGVSPSTPQPRLDVGATLGRGHYGEVFVYDESRVAKRASVLAPREEAAAAAAALSESSRPSSQELARAYLDAEATANQALHRHSLDTRHHGFVPYLGESETHDGERLLLLV